MPTPLTRSGARSLTSTMDRCASAIQAECDRLDIPSHIARDYALRSDMLTDHIERRAIAYEKAAGKDPDELSVDEMKDKPTEQQVDDDPKSDDQNKPETYYEGGKSASDKAAAPEFAQPPKNETGESVEPGGMSGDGWDPNAIGDDRGGPYKQEGDEPYMSGEFTQERFHALRDKQQSGQMPNVDGKLAHSIIALRKLAMTSDLSMMADDLKRCVAVLGTVAGVPGTVVGDVKKQIAAIEKVRDGLIKLDATGEGDPDLFVAAEVIAKAVGEQLPYLKTLETGIDESSPTAMLAFENEMGDGSFQKRIALGAKIVGSAAKSGGKDKEAKVAGDESDDEALKVSDDEESDDSASKKAASFDHGFNLSE